MEVRTWREVGRTLISPAGLFSLVVLAGGAAAAAAAIDGTTSAIDIAAGAGLLVSFLFVLLASMRRARNAFCAEYAKQRGLRWTHGDAVPEATPLLRRGKSRQAEESFTGKLPGGLDGVIALYTYEEQGPGSQGPQTNEPHDFTIVLVDLPGLGSRLPGLYVQRRSGFRFLDGVEDALRSTERIKLESEELDRKCEIFADPDCDAGWLREVFAPTFVDFLAEDSPNGFAFEVENGKLCVNVNRHRGSAKELDALSEAAAVVAKRIRGEAVE